MIKYILIFFISTLALFSQTNSNIVMYEYWLDDNFANKTDVSIANPDDIYSINFSIDVNALSVGMHTLNLRFKDDSSRYSVLRCGNFIKLPSGYENQYAIRKITSYEYWTNNDFENRVTVAVNPNETATIAFDYNANNLQTGLHTMNLRFKDEGGNYSDVQSKNFIKLPGGYATQSAIRKITSYEYWTNNDFENRVTVVVNPNETATIAFDYNANNLQTGLHTMNLRFKDEGGNYSDVQSKNFIKLPSGYANGSTIRKITSYEYWTNNNYANRISVNITPNDTATITFDFNGIELPIGVHTMNLRFKDESGNYSDLQSKYFMRLPSSIEDTLYQRKIIAYRYWFNDSISNSVTISLTTPIDTFNLIRYIAIPLIAGDSILVSLQFKDDRNGWSCTKLQ